MDHSNPKLLNMLIDQIYYFFIFFSPKYYSDRSFLNFPSPVLDSSSIYSDTRSQKVVMVAPRTTHASVHQSFQLYLITNVKEKKARRTTSLLFKKKEWVIFPPFFSQSPFPIQRSRFFITSAGWCPVKDGYNRPHFTTEQLSQVGQCLPNIHCT